jgi:protein SSD1
MLPRLLCEELCSLNPGVERLAFSVTWKMDSNANILEKPWFGKSVIKSCAKLSYDHAQALIEGKDWAGLPPVGITQGFTIDDIRADTLLLFGLSQKMRARRFENGALAINSVKLWFTLDDDGNPADTGVYQLKDSNRLIEEVSGVYFFLRDKLLRGFIPTVYVIGQYGCGRSYRRIVSRICTSEKS